jgi:hypothetical protein
MGGNSKMDDKPAAKAAHVNMMTDTIIANMPAEGLRSVMRGMLGGDATITSNFHKLAAVYFENTRPITIPKLFHDFDRSPKPTKSFGDIQSRYRCLMGCGDGFESMQLLTEVIRQIQGLTWDYSSEGEEFMDILAVIDGDIVQAVTAVQKTLLTSSGMKSMESQDAKIVADLKGGLAACQASASMRGQVFAFDRGMSRLEKLIGGSSKKVISQSNGIHALNGFVSSNLPVESIQLGSVQVPRMFMGLWQFSSPAWGTASRTKINRHFRKHVDAGLVAYGKKAYNPVGGTADLSRYGGPLWRC